MKNLIRRDNRIVYFCISLLFFYAGTVMAADIGTIATNITQSFAGLSKFITAAAFLAGICFALAAILKFKAHRDNPQQVPIGAALILLFVAAAMMFITSFYESLGVSVFGTGATKGSLTGTVIE